MGGLSFGLSFRCLLLVLGFDFGLLGFNLFRLGGDFLDLGSNRFGFDVLFLKFDHVRVGLDLRSNLLLRQRLQRLHELGCRSEPFVGILGERFAHQVVDVVMEPQGFMVELGRPFVYDAHQGGDLAFGEKGFYPG